MESVDVSNNITAPRVPNLRFSAKWSEEGVSEYRRTVTPLLSQIRETWSSTTSAGIMPSATYAAMNSGSKLTIKVVSRNTLNLSLRLILKWLMQPMSA